MIEVFVLCFIKINETVAIGTCTGCSYGDKIRVGRGSRRGGSEGEMRRGDGMEREKGGEEGEVREKGRKKGGDYQTQ